MPRQSEREFLIEVRALLLDLAAQESAAHAVAPQPGDEPVIDMEKVEKLLAGLPLMHQEILFFKLAGYTDETIERMLRVAPRVAEKAMERLAPAHGAAQKLDQDGCAWPAEWLALLQHARAAKKKTASPCMNSCASRTARSAGTRRNRSRSTRRLASTAWNDGRRCARWCTGGASLLR